MKSRRKPMGVKFVFAPFVILAWNHAVKPALLEYAKRTDNKWDDAAIEALDSIIKKVL